MIFFNFNLSSHYFIYFFYYVIYIYFEFETLKNLYYKKNVKFNLLSMKFTI